MKNFSQITLTLLFAVNFIIFPLSVQAVEIDPSKNIFRFQQKMAVSGNVKAQFQLALMYETGNGTPVNVEQAKYWYDISSKKGNQAGHDRAIYLVIRERGFEKEKDEDWLDRVKSDAAKKKSEASLLLGQLYHKGIGVEKDFKKALSLFSQVNAIGEVNADKDIVAVEAEMILVNEDKPIIKNFKHKKQVLVVKKTAPKELSREEKKKKYDAVMLKLKQEQEQIDAQQAWSTGGKVAVVDDEI